MNTMLISYIHSSKSFMCGNRSASGGTFKLGSPFFGALALALAAWPSEDFLFGMDLASGDRGEWIEI
jgi:hypothetical protein